MRKLAARGVSKVPGLRRLPWLRVLALAEIALLLRAHVKMLTPEERKRFLTLMRHPRSLTATQRREVLALVYKMQPKRFLIHSVDKASPVPVPKRWKR